MGISDLSNVSRLFGADKPSEEEQRAMFQEALLLTLARATSADTNIEPVEVASVREVVARVTGEQVSEADIRVAARSELFEQRPLNRCLRRISRDLGSKQRLQIVEALAEIIKSDVRVSPREVEFFNSVANALDVTPAELYGLED